jgi:hypothetical protein
MRLLRQITGMTPFAFRAPTGSQSSPSCVLEINPEHRHANLHLAELELLSGRPDQSGIFGATAEAGLRQAHDCDAGGPLCAEVLDSIGYNGRYTGHDEPALLFYSNVPGSGNHMTYLMRLPKDPLTL